jgi:hypothetical protein
MTLNTETNLKFESAAAAMKASRKKFSCVPASSRVFLALIEPRARYQHSRRSGKDSRQDIRECLRPMGEDSHRVAPSR